MFILSFAIVLPTLLAVAYSSLRTTAWPGGLNSFVAVGLIALVVMTIVAAMALRGPAFAVGFTAISLLVGLGMLAGMFESREDVAGRCLAVLLAGALLCSDLAMFSGWLRDVGARSLDAGIEGNIAAAARWMLFGAGALAYPAFASPSTAQQKLGERAATYGVSAATALTLVVGTITHPPILERLRDAAGAGGGVASSVLRTTAAASALFLVTFTTSRGFALPPLRFRSYGLLFLLLSGFPHRIAYQHLLAMLGLALIT